MGALFALWEVACPVLLFPPRDWDVLRKSKAEVATCIQLHIRRGGTCAPACLPQLPPRCARGSTSTPLPFGLSLGDLEHEVA